MELAGGNTAVAAGAAVTLDASRSADPDALPGALAFSWVSRTLLAIGTALFLLAKTG